MNACGVVETIRISAAGYPIRWKKITSSSKISRFLILITCLLKSSRQQPPLPLPGCPITNFYNDTASLWSMSTQWRTVMWLRPKPTRRRKRKPLLRFLRWKDWNIVFVDDTEVATITRDTFAGKSWKSSRLTVMTARKMSRNTNDSGVKVGRTKIFLREEAVRWANIRRNKFPKF